VADDGTCGSCGSVTVTDALVCAECGARLRASAAAMESRSIVVTPAPAEPSLIRAAALASALWQVPAVRVAVKSGASALAASLALKMARTAIQHRSLAPSEPGLLSQLDGLLGNDPRAASRKRGAEVIEAVLFVRRTIPR